MDDPVKTGTKLVKGGFTKDDPRINRKGRPPGASDRLLALRDAILTIVEGPWPKRKKQVYLDAIAEKYPKQFVTLIAKILPSELKVHGDQRVEIMFPCDSPEELSRKAVEALKRAKEET